MTRNHLKVNFLGDLLSYYVVKYRATRKNNLLALEMRLDIFKALSPIRVRVFEFTLESGKQFLLPLNTEVKIKAIAVQIGYLRDVMK